jgi:hypothetical protein
MGQALQAPWGRSMTLEQFKKLYDKSPFQPFEIHMSDGEKIIVHSREFILAPPTGRTVVIWQPEDDAFNIVDLLLVTNLKHKRESNGSPPTRKKRSQR